MSSILDPMIQKWNLLAKEYGIPGVYIIEVITSAQKKPYALYSSGVLEFEPLHSIRNWITPGLIPMIFKYAFNRVWKYVFHRGIFINTVSYSAVWDIISNKNPEKNPNYLDKDISYG